jgi:cold shock CspA family protein
MSQSEKVTNIGRVKWFNNKAGYGFITLTDGEKSGMDVFVHHSAIDVIISNQYKYLVQGEYVEFSIISVEGGKHEVQASNVTGVNGGKLMYDTRREIKDSVNKYKSTKTTDEKERRPREFKQTRGPREKRTNENKKE